MTHDTTPTTDAAGRRRDDRAAEQRTDENRTTDLHFAYGTDRPDFERFDVKTLEPGELLGEPCAFAVIGQSHLVTAPALGYHEVCSCDPLPAAACETTALDPGETGRVAFESESVRAETTVRVEPLAAFPGAEGADVAYRFGRDAWTTIAVDGDGTGYETYHTYPERDAAVWTGTELARIDSEESGGAGGTETGGGDGTVEEAEKTPEGRR